MYLNKAWWAPAVHVTEEREYEWPYINKELGIRLFYGGPQETVQLERIRTVGSAIVFIDSSIKNLDFLDNFPKRSADIFFVSDETYSAAKTVKLLFKRSTRCLYRDYPIHSLRNFWRWPVTNVRALTRAIRISINPLGQARALLAGLLIALKQVIILIAVKLTRKPIKSLPLGYTGGFAREYDRDFQLEKFDSVIDHSLANSRKLENTKKRDSVFFTGQKGKYERQLMLLEAKKMGLDIGPIHLTFGGPTESCLREKAIYENFVGLRDNTYSLVPPGNYSPESFRLMESLVLMSFPLMPKYVISNPLYSSPIDNTWEEYKSDFHADEMPKIYNSHVIISLLRKIKDEILDIKRELGLP